MKRPSWDEYFMTMTDCVGSRATCDKNGSGCVIVSDNRVIATGYTGSLSGLPHCDEVGHDIKLGQCQRTVHAEHNAITQALKFGISLNGATMYCKVKPCVACAKMANSLGVKRVVTE
ncbi:hypothetical protein A2W67_01395 [Candidatus Nomurabacteria bacterium RIFCSPLOWO2_02_40_28]|uniref:Cytidine and deoxycytidylate deaminase zinc-binding region n=2 Tax=Candidatus Nomuraibacteriota TaxID=1752729 RepID=A0A837HUA9_9BACT|nr:MAG: Cytidine and deoxycytidylate deaminase zinc-binding region [Candidatus Nomurabacteria bacterium GW2011_GWD2_39_12]KKR20635.1 MAG: Cytidine and deoxycytidylate deaminase zinc-binding region [Candidatus Nomurabacteria bacterium GW2011_GWC2_39_41]KKR37436.1 MAG: Cytidine and deoxycytidylate deaminase zinc-binding region [Candidatus Nomurabacteria bacterium GW2011_GWE2_40_10]KKR38684.1 MAG: Cytidine and deoxycytidylate deaminase zinc-binding region [Candidatus Nomurabacteria bacterium GW2011